MIGKVQSSLLLLGDKMLELINVKKIYTTKAGDTAALNGVSVKFPDTGLIFINGKSGSGKTTLLNVIGGLDGLDSGEVLINGKNFSTFTPKEYDSYRNTFVGFIFQEYNLLPDYTVEKNIKIANELQGKETSDEVVAKLMEEFDIGGLQKRKPSELSGGQKQRVAIVRSLLKDPKIIMADEPTGALDSLTGVQVVETLKKLSKDKLVIVVSHDLELAEKYADRIIRIVDGQIVEDVTITDAEISGNIFKDEDAISVRIGADLNPHETEELLKAIREKRKINFIDKMTARREEKTKEVKSSASGEIKLINSKMKVRSSAELGLKSLFVKPGRLVFTIFLSVIAFAVFGLFDTIAAYKDYRIIKNLMTSSEYNAISVYQQYDEDSIYYYNSSNKFKNTVKLSKEDVNNYSKELGFDFRPVYDINESSISDTNRTHAIFSRPSGLLSSVGYYYYVPQVAGMVEFSESEVDANGTIDPKGFNLKLKHGRFPIHNQTQGEAEVAITEYLALSLAYWKGGKDDPSLFKAESVLDTVIEIGSKKYKVVGIYDCGAIPKKYDLLKTYTVDMQSSLADDFVLYLNSGMYFYLIIPQGYGESALVSHNRIGSCYFGNKDYAIIEDTKHGLSGTFTKYDNDRFYNVKDIDSSKILMFDQERDDNVSLADDEILISIEQVAKLYSQEDSRLRGELKDEYEGIKKLFLNTEAVTVSPEMKRNRGLFFVGLKNIVKDDTTGEFTSHIKTISLKVLDDKDVVATKTYKIVGAYVGVNDDIAGNYNNRIQPFVFNSNALDELEIYPTQGIYGSMIAPMNNKSSSARKIALKMTKGDVVLAWRGNNVLETLRDNEEMINQFTQLFLYVSLVLAVFSIFMLYNYISASIVSKKQSIGVLRALGSGGKDIFLMFITESLIISLINGVLASIVAGVGCIFVNMYIKNVMNLAVNFALFGIRQILIIVLASVATGIASSLIPILKIAKEKPVKLIREP